MGSHSALPLRLAAVVMVGAMVMAASAALAQDAGGAAGAGADTAGPRIDPELLKLVPEELRYERVELPADQNAASLLMELGDKVVVPEDPEEVHELWGVLRGEAPVEVDDLDGRVASLVQKNAEALALVKQALQKTKCQFPMLRTINDRCDYLGGLRSIVRIKCLHARVLARHGEFASAATELKDSVVLAELVKGGQGTLLTYLVGIASGATAEGGIRWLARQQGVPEDVLERLLQSLRPASETDQALATALRIEFQLCYLQMLSDEPVPSAFYVAFDIDIPNDATNEQMAAMRVASDKLLDRAATVRTASGFYVRAVRNASLPWARQDASIGADIEQMIKQMEDVHHAALLHMSVKGDLQEATEALSVFENPVGRLYLESSLPLMDVPLRRSFQLRAEREMTRAFLVLRIRQLRSGAYTDSLDALVEEGILPAVPTDPFSGKPLRYDAKRKLIWSVGPDGVDDNAESVPEDWRAEDYVIELP